MRSLFLLLLLANLLLFAAQFDNVRDFVTNTRVTARTSPLNGEKLRIVRDTSNRPAMPSPATVSH